MSLQANPRSINWAPGIAPSSVPVPRYPKWSPQQRVLNCLSDACTVESLPICLCCATGGLQNGWRNLGILAAERRQDDASGAKPKAQRQYSSKTPLPPLKSVNECTDASLYCFEKVRDQHYTSFRAQIRNL